jgi:hypothetical protein
MASPSRPGVHDEPHHHRSLGNGDIQLAITSDRQDATSTCNRIITGMPKRTAKALAHRILHEIEFAEGKRQRRPHAPPRVQGIAALHGLRPPRRHALQAAAGAPALQSKGPAA